MVACGAAEDTASLLLRGEAAHQVEAAANLESRRRCMVLLFEVIAAAQQTRQCRPFVQRRWFHVPVDDGCSGHHVSVSWKGHAWAPLLFQPLTRICCLYLTA